MDKQFWQGKKVLVTGHTGFKGSWLSLWLNKLGAQVVGYALIPPTKLNLFQQANVESVIDSHIGDIRSQGTLVDFVCQQQPDIIFHLAAQSLVRHSYQAPTETYQTNVMGSLHLLEAIRECQSVKVVVMVSTDKCYENQESDQGYTEKDRLGGFDPYSSSKACLEILVNSYRQAFFTEKDSAAIATARAGNVIGGGDWAENRIVPDILKAIKTEQAVHLRSPLAIRPWQHVLEPLFGYLLLAKKLFEQGQKYAQAYNFGPSEQGHKNVQWLAESLIKQMNSNIQLSVDKSAQPHETQCLKLNCSKANQQLNWHPVWNIEQTIEKLASWSSQSFQSSDQMRQYCLAQITQFTEQANQTSAKVAL